MFFLGNIQIQGQFIAKQPQLCPRIDNAVTGLGSTILAPSKINYTMWERLRCYEMKGRFILEGGRWFVKLWEAGKGGRWVCPIVRGFPIGEAGLSDFGRLANVGGGFFDCGRLPNRWGLGCDFGRLANVGGRFGNR